MISLSIIDHHTLFRTCLRDYLSKQKNITVEFDEEDPGRILNNLHKSKTDVILVDLFIPQINGDDLIKTLKQDFPNVKIIVLSMCTELEVISNLIDLGIHSYISKTDNIEDLIGAIYSVYENKIYRNKLFTDALYWHNSQLATKPAKEVIIEFSEREKKIIHLLWHEKSNKEIANELFLGIRSIEKIRQDMKERLSVKTTIGLLKYALNNNIIQEYKENDRKMLKHDTVPTSYKLNCF